MQMVCKEAADTCARVRCDSPGVITYITRCGWKIYGNISRVCLILVWTHRCADRRALCQVGCWLLCWGWAGFACCSSSYSCRLPLMLLLMSLSFPLRIPCYFLLLQDWQRKKR